MRPRVQRPYVPGPRASPGPGPSSAAGTSEQAGAVGGAGLWGPCPLARPAGAASYPRPQGPRVGEAERLGGPRLCVDVGPGVRSPGPGTLGTGGWAPGRGWDSGSAVSARSRPAPSCCPRLEPSPRRLGILTVALRGGGAQQRAQGQDAARDSVQTAQAQRGKVRIQAAALPGGLSVDRGLRPGPGSSGTECLGGRCGVSVAPSVASGRGCRCPSGSP